MAWTEKQSQDSTRDWAKRAEFVTKAFRAAYMGGFGSSNDSDTEIEAEGGGPGTEQHNI